MFFDTKIMIDSKDADEDKRNLNICHGFLDEAKRQLIKLKEGMRPTWEGNATTQCNTLLESFINQIDGLIKRNDNTVNMLNTIVYTYRDADAALAGRMGGGTEWHA